MPNILPRVPCHACHSSAWCSVACGSRKLPAGVDRETCSAVHYQPKQPKTLLVLNRGGVGYETEADLCIKLNRQLILFQTHRLVAGTQASEPNMIKPNPDLLEG